jgi:tRNA(adenine34) deaminase
MQDHHRFMGVALDLAREALAAGEFPVGCVAVLDGRVVARGRRSGTVDAGFNEIDHAEMGALRQLAETIDHRGRCRQATLYSTLEPCLMCLGAALISGVGRIVYAFEDAMGGATGFLSAERAPLYRDSAPEIVAGIRRQESLSLFHAYFADPRNDYWRGSLLARYTLAQPVADTGSAMPAADTDR